MADYFSPTVVQPTIPLSAMTPLELLLLQHIFSSEPDGDGIYFYASEGINDFPNYPIDAVKAALADSDGFPSLSADMVREDIADLEKDAAFLQLDLSVRGWEVIFQDILRRSTVLRHVVVTSAWTCSRMRPDGFGGMAIVITADDVQVRSTDQMIDEMTGIADYGPLGVEPGIGSHILLQLHEEHVRVTLAVIFEAKAPGGLDITDVTDADIRQASLDVKAANDLGHEEADAAFKAPTQAMCLAAERKQAAR